MSVSKVLLTSKANLLPLKVEGGDIVRGSTEGNIDGDENYHLRIHRPGTREVDAERLNGGGDGSDTGDVQIGVDQGVLVGRFHRDGVGELWTDDEKKEVSWR